MPYGPNPATCPVRALRAWPQVLPESGRQPAGPLFLRIDRHGRMAHSRHRNGRLPRGCRFRGLPSSCRAGELRHVHGRSTLVLVVQ
ncbi:hypothetical protein GCM10010309_73280 [Streptomyces violaceochromogenes]|nr:hypothetical protein GCM10010309_73280 [Streptomyces violaceochromogenes]